MDNLSFARNLEFSEHHIDAFQSNLFAGPYPVFYMLGERFTISGHVLDYSRGKPTITYILIITYKKSFGTSLIRRTATFCPHAPGNSRRIDPADSARSAVGGGGDGTAAAPSIRPRVRPPSLPSRRLHHLLPRPPPNPSCPPREQWLQLLFVIPPPFLLSFLPPLPNLTQLNLIFKQTKGRDRYPRLISSEGSLRHGLKTTGNI